MPEDGERRKGRPEERKGTINTTRDGGEGGEE
jgi:hypothetical protein